MNDEFIFKSSILTCSYLHWTWTLLTLIKSWLDLCIVPRAFICYCRLQTVTRRDTKIVFKKQIYLGTLISDFECFFYPPPPLHFRRSLSILTHLHVFRSKTTIFGWHLSYPLSNTYRCPLILSRSRATADWTWRQSLSFWKGVEKKEINNYEWI